MRNRVMSFGVLKGVLLFFIQVQLTAKGKSTPVHESGETALFCYLTADELVQASNTRQLGQGRFATVREMDMTLLPMQCKQALTLTLSPLIETYHLTALPNVAVKFFTGMDSGLHRDLSETLNSNDRSSDVAVREELDIQIKLATSFEKDTWNLTPASEGIVPLLGVICEFGKPSETKRFVMVPFVSEMIHFVSNLCFARALVYELCRGLLSIKDMENPRSLIRVWRHTLYGAEVMRAAHLSHRDIKFDNVLRCYRNIKLSDVGLALKLPAQRFEDAPCFVSQGAFPPEGSLSLFPNYDPSHLDVFQTAYFVGALMIPETQSKFVLTLRTGMLTSWNHLCEHFEAPRTKSIEGIHSIALRNSNAWNADVARTLPRHLQIYVGRVRIPNPKQPGSQMACLVYGTLYHLLKLSLIWKDRISSNTLDSFLRNAKMTYANHRFVEPRSMNLQSMMFILMKQDASHKELTQSYIQLKSVYVEQRTLTMETPEGRKYDYALSLLPCAKIRDCYETMRLRVNETTTELHCLKMRFRIESGNNMEREEFICSSEKIDPMIQEIQNHIHDRCF